MKTINLEENQLDLPSVIDLARHEPLLILTAGGEEFVVAVADDFEQEVESLRRSQAFQSFLDQRSASTGRIPLSDVEAEIEQSIADLEKGDAVRSSHPVA
jgi:PHD/YefM family antitoxin component YafN of YafNO toxin-antitoxin module